MSMEAFAASVERGDFPEAKQWLLGYGKMMKARGRVYRALWSAGFYVLGFAMGAWLL